MRTFTDRHLLWAAVCAVFLLSVCNAAMARWKQDYAAHGADERAWYSRQQTTTETRARIKASWYAYCCDHADTVEAEFSKQNGQWVYRLPGESGWRAMPQDIVQIDVMTPHGKPVLFVDQTHLNAGPICFFPGAAGT